jgi:hypothetical protein
MTAVTRTGQNGFTGADLVAALDRAWRAIRVRHLEVPAAVVVVASGTAAGHAKHGHYAAMRWQHGSEQLPEVLVSGEGLKRPVPEVLTTLMHEAAHGLADARGIKDTSRQGRWHNKRFAALAGELGLDTIKDPRIGWSPCTLRDTTAIAYRDVLVDLGAAMSAYRHPELAANGNGRNSYNPAGCVCLCPRRIRIARSVLDLGPVVCAVCGTDFQPEHE